MQVKAKKRKNIKANPTRVHVDYERIISEAILAIPEPIKGDKGEQGESIQGLKGDKGDSIRGAQGLKGDKGDSIQGAKGEHGRKGTQGDKGIQGNRGKEGKKGKDAVVDYERIFTSLKRELSKDRTLADFSIKKRGGSTLVITKLYRDGRKKEETITLQTGGGTGGGSVQVDPTTVTTSFSIGSTVLSYNANSATAITGTLPASPTAGEFHYITNVGVGECTIDGNGKTVAGVENPLKQYEGLTLEYSNDLGYWVVK